MNWNAYKVIPVIKITEFFTMYHLKRDYNFNFAGEMHNFWECVYVINGSLSVSADEAVHSLKAGSIVFHKPLELHKFNITSESGAELLIFTFNMAGELSSKMERRVCKLNDYQTSIMGKLRQSIDLDIKNQKNCDTNQTHINVLKYIENDSCSIQEKANYIEELIISLSQSENLVKTTHTAETSLYKKAVGYMSENIDTSVSVEDLANKLNVSVSALKRLFAKYAGMSVHKYFLSLKMQKATSLLQEGMNVSEVAYQLGFSSQGYFSAAYKRETGKNPSEI